MMEGDYQRVLRLVNASLEMFQLGIVLYSVAFLGRRAETAYRFKGSFVIAEARIEQAFTGLRDGIIRGKRSIWFTWPGGAWNERR